MEALDRANSPEVERNPRILRAVAEPHFVGIRADCHLASGRPSRRRKFCAVDCVAWNSRIPTTLRSRSDGRNCDTAVTTEHVDLLVADAEVLLPSAVAVAIEVKAQGRNAFETKVPHLEARMMVVFRPRDRADVVPRAHRGEIALSHALAQKRVRRVLVSTARVPPGIDPHL